MTASALLSAPWRTSGSMVLACHPDGDQWIFTVVDPEVAAHVVEAHNASQATDNAKQATIVRLAEALRELYEADDEVMAALVRLMNHEGSEVDYSRVDAASDKARDLLAALEGEERKRPPALSAEERCRRVTGVAHFDLLTDEQYEAIYHRPRLALESEEP